MPWTHPDNVAGSDDGGKRISSGRPSRTLLVALILGPLLLASGLVALAVAGALPFGQEKVVRQEAAPIKRVDRFNVDYAMAVTRMQLNAGPRPAGSRALRKLSRSLRGALPNGRFESIPGHPGLRNIVGEVRGNGGPVIVIGAHYDTINRPRGYLGANDAAAAVGAVVVLSKWAAKRGSLPRGAPTLRFVLFDGEEEPRPTNDFYRDALRGSKAYVRAHAEEVKAMVLLDYIGHPKVRLPREQSSNPALWEQVRAAAGRVGAGAVFPNAVGPEIYDDHTPFLRANIPAVDLIDWDFEHAHKLTDTYDRLDRRSIDAVGETIAQLMTDWNDRARRGVAVLPESA